MALLSKHRQTWNEIAWLLRHVAALAFCLRCIGMWTMVLVAAHARVLQANNSIVMHLCLDTTTKKNREMLEDLLELHLLMTPQLEMRGCSDKRTASSYEFRQRVVTIDSGKPHKGRIQVISALYSPSRKATFSQVEFIGKPSRNAMNERARALTDVLIKAIHDGHEVADPFLDLPQPVSLELSATEIPVNETAIQEEQAAEAAPLRKLGLFIGMERLSQLGFSETFLRSRELVVTKSFMVLGIDYTHPILSQLVLDATVRGGASPLEFLRPLENNRSTATRVSKMLDVGSKLSLVVPIAPQVHVKVGALVSGFFLDSDIAERVALAPLSTYWQLKEGVTLSGTVFLRVFDSRITLLGGYFPFVQNSIIGGRKPFSDYGWQIGLRAESTVYRSFGLTFVIHHRRELFDTAINEQQIRLVNQGTLAYLGVIARF